MVPQGLGVEPVSCGGEKIGKQEKISEKACRQNGCGKVRGRSEEALSRGQEKSECSKTHQKVTTAGRGASLDGAEFT
jgi:hypothetical protein